VSDADPPADGVAEVSGGAATRGPGDVARQWPLVAVLVTLAISNVMANEVLPDWAYIPWNLTVAIALVALAVRGDGCSADDLGLATRRLPDGLRWGTVVSVGVLAVYVVAVAVPATRALFDDDRAEVELSQVLWRTMVAIPFGTVVMEEIAFRGALPAMLRRRTTHLRNGALVADLIAAGLFGLWHVLPSLDLTEANPTVSGLLPGPVGTALSVLAAVAGTAIAGMVLSWLRNRSGSLLAPAMLHCSVNSIGYGFAWLAQR
jgi:membrane protease YdiL (CAAX protease family)